MESVSGAKLAARLRVGITLVCLTGVPLVALVGVGGERANRPKSVHRTKLSERRLAASPAQPPASGEAARGRSEGGRAAPHGEPIQLLLKRLQALGADYYQLEASPGPAEQFWFHCRVAGTVPFEATAPTPLAAVERVVTAVEQWQTRQGAVTRRN